MNEKSLTDAAELQKAGLSPLWESTTAHRPSPPPESPRFWTHSVINRMADWAVAAASHENVERRALTLINERAGAPATTLRMLSCAVQILLPGEIARRHRHSINALRFVLSGSGATTVVDGVECEMSQGDLVLTPGWCWHEHKHEGSDRVVWLDVLDGPLHRFFGTAVFEPFGVNAERLATSPNIWADGLAPADVSVVSRASAEISSILRFPYQKARTALESVSAASDGLRAIRYLNPHTGNFAIPLLETMLVQMSPQWSHRRRSSASALYAVVEGEGESRIGAETYSWKAGDIFTSPAGLWTSHRSLSSYANLFMVSEREVYRRLGLLDEEIEPLQRQG